MLRWKIQSQVVNKIESEEQSEPAKKNNVQEVLSSQSYETAKSLGGPRKISRIEFGPRQSEGWDPLLRSDIGGIIPPPPLK